MSIKIYVGNLPYSMSESDLNGLFVQFGKVESFKIITDRYSGRSKGFGFVEMSVRNEGHKAIDEINGKEFQGRKIKVAEAHSRTDRGGYRGNRAYGVGARSGFRDGGNRRNY